jgi:hypothetical protein
MTEPVTVKNASGRVLIHVVMIAASLAIMNSCAGAAEDAVAVDIGSRREPFVDRFIVGDLRGTSLVLHTPQLMPRIDKPRPHGHYATVLKTDDKFQFYYRGNDPLDNGWKKYGIAFYHTHELTLYAESKDGINWVEPNLGLYKVAHYPNGNIVLSGQSMVNHNFTPFIDTKPGVPAAEKYKALGGISMVHSPKVRTELGIGGLRPYVSPDGIHWRKLQEQPVISENWGTFDSQNYGFWSDAEQAYVCYFRRFVKGYRAIARTTSKDFINWTPYVDMHANLPDEHLYTPCTQPYFRAPHIYFAMPTRFMINRGAATDILFMSTRGGTNFDREFTQSFIRPGIGASGWANRANYAAIGIHQTSPTEMSMFLTNGRRYTIRLDGVASVNAPLGGGELITKPLKFSGNELEINYSTSAAGEIRVELQDANGKALPGFTLADCDPIYGDHIARTVSWQSGTDLGKLVGKPIKIRFSMSDADLFALKFNQNKNPKQAVTLSAKQLKWEASVDKNYATRLGMAYAVEDPRLPRVLLIGDSISIDYTIPVRKMLVGKANVLRIPEDADQSQKGVDKLTQWLGNEKWDVIHFNWGLHDCFRKTSFKQYEANLRAIVKRLKATDAKVIWATTTPIPKGNPWGATAGGEAKYNAIAKTIMEENDIVINDLHTFITPDFTKLITRPTDVHFTSVGSQRLAKPIAAIILKVSRGTQNQP